MRLLLDGWIVERQEDGTPVGAVTNEQKKVALEQLCHMLLHDSEWVELPGVPLLAEEVERWTTYRQLLTNLPSLIEAQLDKQDYPNWLEIENPPTSHMNAAWLRFDPQIVQNGLLGQSMTQLHTNPPEGNNTSIV